MKSVFKLLFFVVLAAICVPSSAFAAPENHEKFARQYMPKSQKIFERFRKDCAETRALRDTLAEDLRVMCREFDDDAVYCALSDRISEFERQEADWVERVKDAFFRHTASMITAKTLEERDVMLADYVLHAKSALFVDRDRYVDERDRYASGDYWLTKRFVEISEIKAAGKRPLVTVKIPGYSYAFGKYEVTQAQYESVMRKNPSNFKGYNLPVENVTWNDAVEFCKKLTARERAAGLIASNQEYCLPSLWEWEHACRAGTTTKYYTGDSDEDLDRAAWTAENSRKGRSPVTHPVGQKEPNAFGLYDMLGNVEEWTSSEGRLAGRKDMRGKYLGGSYRDYSHSISFSLSRISNYEEEYRIWRYNTREYEEWQKFSSDRVGFRVVLESRRVL